jgi:hypothetical protein
MALETASPAAGPPDAAGRPTRRPEAFANWLLGRPLSALVGLWCLARLGSWIPSYLTRPWFIDHEHFAILAQSWDAGLAPYTGQATNQFPGEIYVFWALGKLFGWGNTTAFYAFDAGLVVAFAALLVAWSIREFGRALYGLLGLAAFLGYYLAADFQVAGQREWHATFLAVASLLALRLGRGWPSLATSAVAFGLALVFRPQVVLLFPGIVLALLSREPDPDRPRAGALLGKVIAWGLIVTAAFGAGLIPLAAHGLVDDLFRLATTPYRLDAEGLPRFSGKVLRLLLLCFENPEYLLIPAAVLLLSCGERGARRATSWAVAVAMLGLTLYQVISPIPHRYYHIPARAMLGVGVACLAWQLRTRERAADLALVGVLLAVFAAGLDLKPTYASRDYGIVGLRQLRSGGLPVDPVPGQVDFEPYTWPDLRDAILHLRQTTDPTTPVASLVYSKTALLSMVPRRSAIPVDYVAFWWFRDRPSLEKDLAALREARDAVVVWDPSAKETKIPEFRDLFEAVRRDFVFDARFGPIEVWRRRDGAGGTTAPAPAPAPPGPEGGPTTGG